MIRQPTLTSERLRELLDYDPASGVFTWRQRPANCVHVGDVAGFHCGGGYIQIRIDGALYLAHRLAFLYVNGTWPVHQIDHRNCCRDDNRWHNLREATPAENQRNRGRSIKNTSGFKGVSFHKASGRWQTKIRIEGLNTHLGYFSAAEDAYAAYCKAAHEHHGAFARTT